MERAVERISTTPTSIERLLMRNYKYINEWLSERNICLSSGFAKTLRDYAKEYQNAYELSLSDVYSLLGCSKQNVSYWESHCDSTQSKNTIYKVISRAAELFCLSENQAENLANSAGLSLYSEGGDLMETLRYFGKKGSLCNKAMVSERMLRHYKKNSNKAGAYGYCHSPRTTHR